MQFQGGIGEPRSDKALYHPLDFSYSLLSSFTKSHPLECFAILSMNFVLALTLNLHGGGSKENRLGLSPDKVAGR
jgi:hypothetical protein